MSVQSSFGPEMEGAKLAGAHLRRNFTVLAADYGLFSLGLTFASVSTILPAFAEHLGAPNIVIGAIPAVVTLGQALPSLFAANYTERLPRKLHFILAYTVWERLPLLALAVVVYFLSLDRPGLVLAALLVLMAAVAGMGGFLAPAWMDLIGKVIPTDLRGRLFASGSTIGTGLGLGGAVLAGYFLETFPFPLNYSLCLATGFACLVLSFVCLALTVEPAVASSKPPIGMGAYLRRLPGILARQRDFAWYLASRALGVFALMANGFYTVFALRELGAPEWEAAGFTFALLASQTVANLAFGYIADRTGHKLVLLIGALAVVLGNSIALATTTIGAIYVVFVCMSVGTAATVISALNLSMEFAPPEDRPTYVGLANTLIAPVMFISPLIGGLLADQAGYRVVFGVSSVFAALSLWVLATRVRDPRTVSRVAEVGTE
ncbi:MAG: MFS transporter [Chloroflexi bacterium]|nr:MFS transporter [Chloroflexota bacterium]